MIREPQTLIQTMSDAAIEAWLDYSVDALRKARAAREGAPRSTARQIARLTAYNRELQNERAVRLKYQAAAARALGLV